MTIDADSDLLAIVVHEVRSPVAALAAISDALTRGPFERDRRRQLARLAIAACHGIERTLTDADVASVRLERLHVRTIVEDAVAAARLRGADVRADVESGLAPIVGDPDRIRQALDNLLANALKHARGAPILVAARMAGACVVVSVSDRGQGIEPQDQARIFEPGARLDASRPGSGLGLTLTRAIASAHGGSVTVESVPGEGATFSVEFPAAD